MIAKIFALGFFVALLAHSKLVAPTLTSASVRMALAIGLLCALVPVVRDWVDDFVEG